MPDEFNPFGGGAFGDQPFGPSPEEAAPTATAITDLDALQLPINCVLHGQQFMPLGREYSIGPQRRSFKATITKSVVRVLSKKSSFTVTTNNRGY